MEYPWKNISPKDTVNLMKFTFISDLHMRSLISLYQPLVGKEAVSLYLILKEYLDQTVDQETMLSDILAQLNCGVKDYYQARIKLEAYGLIRVFKHQSDDSNYALGLEAPMTPYSFFADSMMKMMLIEKLGERLVNELEERFQVHSQQLAEYREVTKSFLDVIHLDMEKMSGTVDKEKSNQTMPESITDQAMNSDQFDWSFFVEGLNKHYINSSSLDLKMKKLIYTFHVIYNINELEMQKFVLEAADIASGEVDENKLTSIIQKRYLKQSKPKESENVLDNQAYKVSQLKQKGFSTEEIEIIMHAQNMNPYAYLKSIKQQKGGFVSSNETWLLKELVENAPLSTAVINILINYLLIIKDAPTLEKSIATKIANDWAQSQVKSPEEAMQKVKQLYASFKEKQQPQQKAPRKNYSNSNNRSTHARKETLPEWATKTAEKDKPLSKEKEEDLKTRLEKIRSKRREQS